MQAKATTGHKGTFVNSMEKMNQTLCSERSVHQCTPQPPQQAAVVVILYTPTPSLMELASFRQCITVLKRQPLVIACPLSLNTACYERVLEEAGASAAIERFNDKCFTSVASYNNLMKSLFFYERFSRFTYILIYQLDAWVFRDELNQWCEKGYEYIGAPWYTSTGKVKQVCGNGGFSLRKVATFIKVLSGELQQECQWNYSYIARELQNIPITQAPFEWLRELLVFCRCRISLANGIYRANNNEDYLFAKVLSAIYGMKMPDIQEAFAFSFEQHPEDAFRRTAGQLPFGCHAFEKNNPEFWSQWIPALKQLVLG